MSSVGTIYPSTYPSSTTNAAGTASSSGSSSSDANATNSGLASTSSFLQLLVAQLKNQDPLQPMDGTQFVTQLAQINDVQQNLGMKQDLDAMSEKYLGTTAAPSASSNQTTTSSAGTAQTV